MTHGDRDSSTDASGSVGSAVPAAANEEVEWQLDAPELGAVERWLDALPGGRAPGPTEVGAPRPALIEDIYLDTDDRRLRHAGYALRVRGRRRGGALRVEATLKGLAGGEAGPRRREERSEPLPDAPDAAAAARDPAALCAANGPVGGRVRELAGSEPLHEILRIYTDRRTRELRAGGAEVGELAIDRCALLPARGSVKRLERVEVELTPGTAPDALERFVDALSRAGGLRRATASKLEVGLGPAATREAAASVTSADPPVPPASLIEGRAVRLRWPPPLRRRARMPEAARAALAGPLAMLIAAEPVARRGADAEGVHDMRVGTRRLRAALALYGPALPPAARALRAELRWLANALGEVRDLDVQLERIEQLAAADGGAAPAAVWAPLALVLARRWDEARTRELLPALEGERYRALLSELHALVGGSAGETPAATERAASALLPALERRGRRLERALARAGPRGTAEHRHLARIEAKRMRYAIECCAALYGRPARRAITALRRLQELLGAERDASTAADALHAIASGADGSALPPPTLHAMGELAERERARAQELVERLPAARARAETRWRRLRSRVRSRGERQR